MFYLDSVWRWQLDMGIVFGIVQFSFFVIDHRH